MCMEWLRAHPVAIGTTSIVALLATLIIVINASAPEMPEGQVVAWGGLGSPLQDPRSSGHTITPKEQDTSAQMPSNPAFPYISSQPASGTTTQTQAEIDFEALMGLPAKKSFTGQTALTSDDLSFIYQFIPKGIISATSSTKARTPTEQALYDYGNSAGALIQTYESSHTGQIQILTDQVADRTSVEKAEKVVQLGRDLETLGRNLSNMKNVPKEIATDHADLAKSYIEIGTKLRVVPTKAGDAEFIAAIQAYNASADVYARSFVKVAEKLGAFGVRFASGEAGSVFTFTQSPRF
jgi:hypothetical protein